MTDRSERLLSGELSGRDYFRELEQEYLDNGTLTKDKFGMVQRSSTAPPLQYLPGHEPAPQITPEQDQQIERFLKMPPIFFDEE